MRGDRYFEELLVSWLLLFAGSCCTGLGRGTGTFLTWVGVAVMVLGLLGVIFYEYKRSRS
jgi:hypothetical protein